MHDGFAVTVRSFVQGSPARSDDNVPGRDRLSKKVRSYLPS